MRNISPYRDFLGDELAEGDEIIHPISGERGTIVFLPKEKSATDKWRVDYHDGSPLSRLILQVDGKGMAVKLTQYNAAISFQRKISAEELAKKLD